MIIRALASMLKAMTYPILTIETKRFSEEQEKMRDMHNATRWEKNKNAVPGEIVDVGNGFEAIYGTDGEMIWNSYVGCCGRATYVS